MCSKSLNVEKTRSIPSAIEVAVVFLRADLSIIGSVPKQTGAPDEEVSMIA